SRRHASVAQHPQDHVHAEAIAIAREAVEVVGVVALALPAVRGVGVHADEHHQAPALTEYGIEMRSLGARSALGAEARSTAAPLLDGGDLRDLLDAVEHR